MISEKNISPTKTSKANYLLFIFVFISISSCDSAIDPLDKETGVYAVYGVLDLNKETNFIRVRDLNVPFTLEATEFLDAKVTLEHLNSGSTYTLESERKEYDGVYLHNFKFNEFVIPDNTYQLTVTRSDGRIVNMTIETPTKPTPQIAPINQNCFTPITFKLDPLYESTLVLQIGYFTGASSDRDDSKFYKWSSPYIFKPDSTKNKRIVTYSFLPKEELSRVSPFRGRKCSEILREEIIYINYTHYGAGFYEKVFEQEFDIMDTQQFGPLYYDTLAIPIDTSRVCPQECE